MIKRWQVRILAGAVGEFSSPELTLCADSLSGVCSTPMLPRGHVKDPDHSAKSAGGRLHLNSYTPLTHRNWSALTLLLSRYLSGNELTDNLSGNILPQSSQHSEPLWTDPAIDSGISVRKLISTLKKKIEKCRRGMNSRTFSQNHDRQGKSNHRYENHWCRDTHKVLGVSFEEMYSEG